MNIAVRGPRPRSVGTEPTTAINHNIPQTDRNIILKFRPRSRPRERDITAVKASAMTLKGTTERWIRRMKESAALLRTGFVGETASAALRALPASWICLTDVAIQDRSDRAFGLFGSRASALRRNF